MMSNIFIDLENLPTGWFLTPIVNFAEVLMGQSPPSDTYNESAIGLPFFQGKTEFTDLYPVVRKWCNASNKIAEPNDILLSVRAPVGATNIANVKCCIGRGLASIRYPYCYKFLFYYFRLVEKKLDEKGTGTTFRAISGDVIKNANIFLPPLAEQQRIVAKIEELFSELDKGIEALKKANQQLKVYRQAVLKYAFEGRLTNPNVKEGELPEGWVEITFGNIFKISSGDGLPKSSRNDDGVYLVYGGNGVSGKHSEFMFNEQKLIIGRVGAHCGNTHITMQNSWVTDNAFVVDFDTTAYDMKFLYYLIFKSNFNTLSSSTAQPVISQGKIYPFETVVPIRIYEQIQIVNEIESRLSVCDKIEESIEQGLQQAEALRQSILKKAFEGKLVPQDPNDEPASVLLERIKAESQKALPVRKVKVKLKKVKA